LLAGPIAAYTSAGPNQTNVVSGQMGIIAAMQSPIGAGATVTFFLPDVMGGPAILDFSPFDQAAGVNITSWSLFVEQTPDLDTGSSAPQPIVSRTSAGDGNRRHTGMIYLPARPTMLSLTSGDASPRHFDLTLELDRDRVG
jgi:hypothetical protein